LWAHKALNMTEPHVGFDIHTVTSQCVQDIFWEEA
jgi:hypothetical protein